MKQPAPTPPKKASAAPKNIVKSLIYGAFQKFPHTVISHRLTLPGDYETGDLFNVRTAENVPFIDEKAQQWKREQKSPMNILIYYAPQGYLASESAPERYLLEHWQMSHIPKSADPVTFNGPSLYQTLVVLFRALLVHLRLLPAHKVFLQSKAVMGEGSRVAYEIADYGTAVSMPFGTVKPEKVEIGKVDTSFGILDVSVHYRRDISFALNSKPEVLPAMIPDYAPSRSQKIPMRLPQSKPLSIQPLQRHSSSSTAIGGPDGAGGRQRSATVSGAAGRGVNASHGKPTEAHSQPQLQDHSRLSFSPPGVGAQSYWPLRQRVGSDAPFPAFSPQRTQPISYPPSTTTTTTTEGASGPVPVMSASPRSLGPESFDQVLAAVRSSTSDGGERVLTATSPPTFSMYERAMHESPDPELDGPMFAFEQSFAADEEEQSVSSFVRYCQSKPNLAMIEEESKNMKPGGTFSQFVTMIQQQRKNK